MRSEKKKNTKRGVLFVGNDESIPLALLPWVLHTSLISHWSEALVKWGLCILSRLGWGLFCPSRTLSYPSFLWAKSKAEWGLNLKESVLLLSNRSFGTTSASSLSTAVKWDLRPGNWSGGLPGHFTVSAEHPGLISWRACLLQAVGT